MIRSNVPTFKYIPPNDCIYCRRCRTQVACIQDYILMVHPGGIFRRMSNVVVRRISENTIAKTYCIRCRTMLGWKFIAVPPWYVYAREGRFFLKLHELCFWNGVPLLHLNMEQDLGANEQNADQNLGANEQNVDQDLGANEQFADQEQNVDQDLGANEENGDHDGDANEQELGANKRNADQDADINVQVPNEQEVGANEQNADQDLGANEENADQDGGSDEQNHDQDGGSPMN